MPESPSPPAFTALAASTAFAAYSARLTQAQALTERLRAFDGRLSLLRLAAAAAAGLVGAAAALFDLCDIRWTLLPAAAFFALLVAHERVIGRLRRSQKVAALADAGLARLDGRWIGSGDDGMRFFRPEHPYALDLDIAGRGSLFERLCSARSESGRETLAAWLGSGASGESVVARQEAVRELTPAFALREEIALLADDVEESARYRARFSRATPGPATLAPAALAAWAAAPTTLGFGSLGPGAVSVAGSACCLLNLTLGAGYAAGRFGPAALGVSLVLSVILALYLRLRLDRLLAAAEPARKEMQILARLLARFERERFISPVLRKLQESLQAGGGSPARRLAWLSRWFEMLSWRNNQMFLPLSWLFLWKTQLAAAIEHWRVRHGADVARWLEAVGEIEALLALSAWAFENPDDTFPVVEAGSPGAPATGFFEARGLGHPLLPAGRLVRNDVALSDGCRLLVVSGSNMSGKSTLVRAVGVNAVLALAGAPVRAEALRLSPLRIGASIRVTDSLLDGHSLFYAEILRLRQLMEVANNPPPLLFLLDEILHGTNSHDRRIGASAVVRGLIERGGVGLVTTHDLALAAIADSLGGRGRNVHFVDTLEDGRMYFDYRLHDGVVRKSNALELMRAVGLDV